MKKRSSFYGRFFYDDELAIALRIAVEKKFTSIKLCCTHKPHTVMARRVLAIHVYNGLENR
jgi:hypothetical protein